MAFPFATEFMTRLIAEAETVFSKYWEAVFAVRETRASPSQADPARRTCDDSNLGSSGERVLRPAFRRGANYMFHLVPPFFISSRLTG